MIKDNQTYFNRLHVVLDALITVGSYILAWFIRIVVFSSPGEVLPKETYFAALYFILPGYLLLYFMMNLYRSKRYSSSWKELIDVIKANLVGLVSFFVILYIINEPNFSRSMIIIFSALNIFFMTLMRKIVRAILRSFRKKGYNLKHILLVGYSRATEQYIDRILANPEWGYHVCGILDDTIPAGTIYRDIKVLGSIGNLEYILPENKMDEIAITLSLSDYDKLEGLVNLCEKFGVHTKFIPDYNSVIPSRPYTEDLMGLPVVNIRRVPLTNTFNWIVKRIVDIIGSLVAIVVFSPVMLFAAIAIKLQDKGPVIFKQTRVGLHNREFEMYKFRTMRQQTEEDEAKAWTVKDDERVT
ncbi:MAG: sugar transferase, partial [Lachnospiraceae bacterium]|nr:sugar transferase [Lachnospiraceae bacterium]